MEIVILRKEGGSPQLHNEEKSGMRSSMVSALICSSRVYVEDRTVMTERISRIISKIVGLEAEQFRGP
ncbi:unnamed protein product [Cylicocyclus nassatus]|uniref:Uncharacterized protein n=1 Tax=Cylicocyclus nassatus TaxID=53992 RepID=A0AA36M4H1_CYLNA|nr:unnamed protein product [Cylicocyclus nassatus]